MGAYVVRGPRADGRFYWQATATVAGERKTIWSGWATRQEAEPAIAEARAALPADLGAAEAAARQEERAALTVAVLLDRWLEDCATRPLLSPLTMETYRREAANLARLLGAYRLDRVGIQHTQGFLSARYGEGVRMRTAWIGLKILRTAWRWGHAARLHAEPLHIPSRSSVKLEPVERARVTRSEAWATYDCLRGLEPPMWIVRSYLIGLLTGARTAEIHALRVGDFDLDAGTVRMGRDRVRDEEEATKTGARTVVLDPGAVALLREHVSGRDPAERFIGEIVAATMRQHVRYVRRAARQAGAPRHTLYSLRHSAVDTLYEAGADPAAAGAQLGHSPDTAQRHYRRVREEGQRRAAFAAALGQRPTPSEPAGNVVPLRRRAGAKE